MWSMRLFEPITSYMPRHHPYPEPVAVGDTDRLGQKFTVNFRECDDQAFSLGVGDDVF